MVRGPEQTKSELLRAAKEEFAEYGLAGARVDRIAKSARINKQRIYGHFGSKDGLFDAVLRQAMVEAAADKPLQPGDSLASYAARTFDFHRDHPELLRLLLWESLSRPSETALGDSERQAHYKDKIAAFQAAGFDDREARYALFFVLALSTYARALPQVTALVLGADRSDEELRDRIVTAIATLAGIENPGVD